MFRGQCLTKVLLHYVTFSLFAGCSALNPGVFHSCPQGSCNSSLSNNPCPVVNNACTCSENNSSAYDSLDQQTFVNLTGATNENASQWTCCFCSLNSSYCCDKCSSSTTPTTRAVNPPTNLPTRYFRILLVFVLECNQFSNEEDNLNNSLRQGINSLTGMPLDQVTVTDTSCATGQQPYCGVDVEGIRAHHRAKRLAVGGRMNGKTKTKQNPKDNSHSSYQYQRSSTDVTCDSLSANITVSGQNVTRLEMPLHLLRQLQLNNSLDIPLWDGGVISSSFMLSAMDGTSYSLHEAPTPKSLSPTEPGLPQLTVDIKPIIYAAAAFGGLITLCIVWKFIKHSWLLSRKKFTPINSDRVDHKKSAQQLTKQQKIMLAMEENHRMPHANGSAFTTRGLPRSHEEATKEHPNWSSPGYPARSLVPAYKPTELHNQRTPPRLILDDDGSDLEDRRSIDSGSIGLGDDENLSDILNSDDERGFRPSSVRSHFSKGIKNPGFVGEINMDETAGQPNKIRRKSQSPSLANGNAKLSVNTSDVPEERKASTISSDLSLDAGEQTVFLPVKKENKTKKQEKAKKSENILLSANTEKHLRRGSVTPVNEDDWTRKPSATEAKIPQKLSTTLQVTEGEKRRKSITNTTDDRKVSTPKDTYAKGKKTTKVSTLENGTKSVVNEELDVGNTGGPGKGKHGRSTSPASPRPRKTISTVASGGNDEVYEKKQKRIPVTSASPFNERRKSTVADVEQGESSKGYEIRLKETSTPAADGRKNSIVADDGKRKKKKQKNGKEKKKKKKKTVDSDESSEDAMAALSDEITGLNATTAASETQRRPSAVLQEKETKVKKKKKRKDRERKKRKTEDSELSGEDEATDNKTRHLDVDIAVPEVETKRRKSVFPDETQKKKKKKKQNEATTARRKSEIPTARHRDQDTNGFVHSAKSLRMDSLAVTPDEKRRKSLVIEDIESKSQTSDTSSRRKSVSPDVPADWKRPGSDQNIARVQPKGISPKSPRLIIKPSYHKY